MPIVESPNSFRFGDIRVKPLGTIEIGLEFAALRRCIPVLMDIVQVDVPPLLGLDVLDSEHLYAVNVTKHLVLREVLSERSARLNYIDRWHVPLIRHDGHFYAWMSFPRCIFHTIAQLQKLHRQFAPESCANY